MSKVQDNKIFYPIPFATLILAIWMVATFFDHASAIPAFARKYRAACTTCHVAIPYRNAFGEAFRRNGYIMPKQDKAQVKQEPVELGADAWKAVFPNTVWPGLLPAEFPIAAYVHQRFVADLSDSRRGDVFEFDMPHELEIFMGGTFDRKFSFFGEYVLFENGKNLPKLKRLFLRINDVIGPENAVNISLGRIEPGITDGLTDNQRVTLTHATVLDYQATGRWRPRNQQSGIEVNGILKHQLQYAVGVVNGERGLLANDQTNKLDFYGRLGFKWGGLPLDGYRPGDETVIRPSNYWVDNSVSVGVYGYSGSDIRYNWSARLDNDFVRYGVDLHLNRGRFDLYAGMIAGKDDNPNALLVGTDVEKEVHSVAWFGEGYYLLYPWLISVVRLGGASSDQDDNDIDKFITLSPNLTILARENVRFTLEVFARFERDKTDKAGNTTRADKSDELKWIKANVLFAF